MKTTPKQIDDIYIFMITAQFLLDHAEDNILSEKWCSRDLKQSLKTCMDKLKNATSIPFTQLNVKATAETVEQHVNGSMLAENNMRLSLNFDRLNKEEQFRFQLQYDNLLSQFGLDKL